MRNDFDKAIMICEHSKFECPYTDCNYHVDSSGRFRYSQDNMPDYLPATYEEAEQCDRNLDI